MPPPVAALRCTFSAVQNRANRSTLKALARNARREVKRTIHRMNTEDEGPLPPKARADILAAGQVFADHGAAVLGPGGRQLFEEMAPLLVAHELWHRRAELGEPGTMQAYHLVERICSFVRERGPRGRRSVPSPSELRARFGADGDVVRALWRCVRVLEVVRAARSCEEEFTIWRQYRILCTILASVHRLASSPFDDGDRNEAVHDLQKILGDPRLVALIRKRLRGSRKDAPAILLSIRDKLLRSYKPGGNERQFMAYLRRALTNKIRDSPMEFRGPSRNSRHAEGVDAECLHIAASSRRKRKDLPPEAAHADIERGRVRQQHRDPSGEWQTLGQLYEVLRGAGYTMSLTTMRTEYKKAVEAGEIRPTNDTDGVQKLFAADQKTLERRLRRFKSSS